MNSFTPLPLPLLTSSTGADDESEERTPHQVITVFQTDGENRTTFLYGEQLSWLRTIIKRVPHFPKHTPSSPATPSRYKFPYMGFLYTIIEPTPLFSLPLPFPSLSLSLSSPPLPTPSYLESVSSSPPSSSFFPLLGGLKFPSSSNQSSPGILSLTACDMIGSADGSFPRTDEPAQ